MADVFKIPAAMHPKYHGAGYALAAVAGGQIIDLVYLRHIDEDWAFEYLDDDDAPALVAVAITDPKLGPTVRQLQALGEVFVGMCSCYEFVEL